MSLIAVIEGEKNGIKSLNPINRAPSRSAGTMASLQNKCLPFIRPCEFDRRERV